MRAMKNKIFDFFRSMLPVGRFPQTVDRHWYCGAWYTYICELRNSGLYHGTSLSPDPCDVLSPAEGRVAFNPFRTGHAGSDTSGLVDGLIPAIRFDDRVGLYRQVGGKYHDQDQRFYDGAPWDDGYMINLEFAKWIPVWELPFPIQPGMFLKFSDEHRISFGRRSQ